MSTEESHSPLSKWIIETMNKIDAEDNYMTKRFVKALEILKVAHKALLLAAYENNGADEALNKLDEMARENMSTE